MPDRLTTRMSGIAAGIIVIVLLTPVSAARASALGSLRDAGMRAPGAIGVLAMAGPNLDRTMRRTVTRAERSMTRFALVLGYVAGLWVWAALNIIAFLAVTALACVADLRMLALWRHGAPALLSEMASGMRTYFRLVRDRRTPLYARAVLALALLYWLLPNDLISEGFFLSDGGVVLSGLIEDLILAACAAKLFMYLCPNALVEQHAAAVESRAHAHA
jgi:uncharacterized membrane protein YkvA (DUF1232 family)